MQRQVYFYLIYEAPFKHKVLTVLYTYRAYILIGQPLKILTDQVQI